MTKKSTPINPDLHHANATAVRTYPGRTIADPPEILFKTFIADLETTGAVPAKRQNLTATVALELFFAPAPLRI